MAVPLHRGKAPPSNLVVAGIAVLAVAALYCFGAGEERSFAVDTHSIHNTAADTPLHDEFLVVADPATAPPVTALASRHEIGDGIVPPIPVNVVNHKGTFMVTDAGHPIHGSLAPVTGMRSHADSLEQNEAVFRDEFPVPRQKMFWPHQHLSARKVASALMSMSVSTLFCAEGSHEGRGSCVLFPAVIACSGDWHTVTVHTPRAKGKSLCKGYS